MIELLTVMVLMGILLPAIALVLTSSVRWSTETQEDSVIQAEARGAIDRVASEIRQAYSGDLTSPIQALSGTNGITFLTPDRTVPLLDGTDAFHVRKIQYRINGSSLERASWTSTNTTPNAVAPTWTFPATAAVWVKVLGSIKNPTAIFEFRDLNSAVTATASAVRSVKVTLTVGTNTSQGRKFTYQSTATLRVGT
jgi:type II secretory pathway pseudopilin PulG